MSGKKERAKRKAAPKTVAVVTAWQNHPELEHDYFAAIEMGKPDQLVIVDDGSWPPLPFAQTRLEVSGGFCTANNLGLTLVETDHVVFVNNDVRAYRPGWLDDIRRAIEPNYIVGPLLDNHWCLVDGVGYPYIDGWCLGMTTADARRLGPWDETYDRAGPGYFSDTILAFEARVQGFTLRDVKPGLHHKGGTTGGADPERFQRALRVNQELFASRVREVMGVPE